MVFRNFNLLFIGSLPQFLYSSLTLNSLFLLPKVTQQGYAYYQAEQLCSIGSGAVESAVKQIGRRLKISGAQWKPETVNQMLHLRCAYLNGLLAV